MENERLLAAKKKHNVSREYRNIALFFDSVYKKKISEGYSKIEARAYAYDAIELRYEIGESRARVIVSKMHKTGINLSNDEKTRIISSNKELIEILQFINDEYARR